MTEIREQKRVRMFGGPAHGKELVLDVNTRCLVVPHFVKGKGISEYIYTYTGQVTHDYIELWE